MILLLIPIGTGLLATIFLYVFIFNKDGHKRTNVPYKIEVPIFLLVLVFSISMPCSAQQEKGYLIVITRLKTQKTKVHRVVDVAVVDSLFIRNKWILSSTATVAFQGTNTE